MIEAPKCPECGSRMQKHYRRGDVQRWRCRRHRPSSHCSLPVVSATPRTSAKQPIFTREMGGATRFLVTAAQNATPVHLDALASMQCYCEINNAELLVIPYRYQNPTSVFPESQKGADVWADEVQPYLLNSRKNLHPELIVLGDIRVQPTAIAPLSGLDALTHGESGIVGHPKLHFKTVPTPQNKLPKIMTTTGTITGANYTDSLAGKRGAFHHTIGATLVELKGKKFHLRQINCEKETGNFYDLDTYHVPSGVHASDIPALALVGGDVHVWFSDIAAVRAFHEQIRILRPRYIILHDLSDGYVFNPHHKDNPFVAVAKIKSGYSDARKELTEAIDFATRLTADYPFVEQVVIVPSNHNDFLQRAIEKSDWRHNPGNAEFMLETQLELARAAKVGARGFEGLDAFTFWARKLVEQRGLTERVRVLDRDESFALAGVELGMHGDVGPKGARGSIKNLRRIGVKSIIGHSHGPGIDEGCYQVGTMTPLRLEYNRGPGDWLNTNCVLYANGKRSLLNSINGEWRV